MTRIRRAVRYLALYSLLWWLLTEGRLDQWWLGVCVVLLATLASFSATTRDVWLPIRPVALARLAPVFMYQSFKGGVQVALLAFDPRRRVKPYFAEVTLSVEEDDGLTKTVLAATMCLMPGTVSCRVRGDVLLLHVLDEGLLNLAEIAILERLVAAVFSRQVRLNPNAG